jgi:hypothetical protein
MALDFPSSPTTGQTYTGSDGTIWKWDGTKWVSGATGGAYAPLGAVNNVGRNLVHNPLFNIAQRGTGPFTANGAFTLDRWRISVSLDTASIAQSVAIDADRLQLGDEAAAYVLSNNFTGNAGAAAYHNLYQGIEDVRRLAGKTVTLSFYARCGTGALKLGTSLLQSFGSGGSPSAQVQMTAQTATLSTTWTRYNMTFVVPGLAGKTVGTNNDHGTYVLFYFSSGATNAAVAGNPGVQSGAIVLWGVQLEVGGVATPLEKPDPRYEHANCQRFYTLGQIYWAGYQVAASTVVASTMLPVTMRATPTFTITTNASTNFGSPSIGGISGGVYAYGTSVSTGASGLNVIFNASADL